MSGTRSLRPTSRTAFPQRMPLLQAFDQRMRQLLDEPMAVFNADGESALAGWMPATDVTERDDELVLTAELPGMTKEHVHVAVESGVLMIKGEKTEEKEEEEQAYRLWERHYGSFQRAFTLPPSVDAAGIKATMRNGLLTVRMPKSANARAKGRKVDISG